MGILFSKLEYIWVRQNMIHCEFLFTVSPGPAPGPGVAGTHCDAGPGSKQSVTSTDHHQLSTCHRGLLTPGQFTHYQADESHHHQAPILGIL